MLVLGCGCGEDSSSQPGGGGGGGGAAAAGSGGQIWGGSGGTGNASGSGGSSGTGAVGGCPPKPFPNEVPEGFEEFTDYSCDCRFYVPGPKAKPLAPVEWEACPQNPGPQNTSCRRMKTPWTKTFNLSMTGAASFWHDRAKDKSYLQFDRVHVDDLVGVRYRLVADAEGPILTALLERTPGSEGCGLTDAGLQGGRYLFRALGESIYGPIQGSEGALGGKFGEAPSTVIKQPMDPKNKTVWRMTSEWIIRWRAGLFARPWEGGPEVTVYDIGKDPEALTPSNVQGIGKDIFFEVGSGGFRGTMAWTKSGGLAPILRFFGDKDQGTSMFGTDGVNMVWFYGKGKGNSSLLVYPERSVMTAPYSTDPATVAKTARRLRSDPGQPIPFPYAVGCGHAARTIYSGPEGNPTGVDLFVVRLKDGVSWVIQSTPSNQGAQFLAPMGITCDEIFTKFQFVDDAVSIARIRLDSLGPGTPPD